MKKFAMRVMKNIRNIINNETLMQQILINQGKILEEIHLKKETKYLSDYEWKVFSQWGEDGIIHFLTKEVEIVNKTFIEFGVEDFYESNCRYLLMSSDWQGFVIDGSFENISRLRASNFYWKYDLQALSAFVNVDNINELLSKSTFHRDLGILSVDIDGNDYHILSSINAFEPRIVISEFNPYFGKTRAISVPYDPRFYRTEKHFSNLYYGASIKALENLLGKKDYTLVGTGVMGCNAYFVRNNLMTDKLFTLSENPMRFNGHFRESRDENGKLSLLRGEERLGAIKGLPVLNVLNGNIEDL